MGHLMQDEYYCTCINRKQTHRCWHIIKYYGFFFRFGAHTTNDGFVTPFVMHCLSEILLIVLSEIIVFPRSICHYVNRGYLLLWCVTIKIFWIWIWNVEFEFELLNTPHDKLTVAKIRISMMGMTSNFLLSLTFSCFLVIMSLQSNKCQVCTLVNTIKLQSVQSYKNYR